MHVATRRIELTGEDLGIALLVDVLHRHDDAGLAGVRDEVHCSADSPDFAREHEVGQVWVVG